MCQSNNICIEGQRANPEMLRCRENSARQCAHNCNDENVNAMQLLSTEMDERLLKCAMEAQRGK